MRNLTVLLAGALLLAASGCATMRTAKERNQYLATQLDGLRYEKPMAEVWLQVRRMLAEKGYPLAEADASLVGQDARFLASIFSPVKETRIEPLGGRSAALPGLLSSKPVPEDEPGRWSLETGWSEQATRYRVDGSTDGKTCRVTFTAMKENTTDHGHDRDPHRDLDMELDLAWRVDPEAAARIEKGLEALAAKEAGY